MLAKWIFIAAYVFAAGPNQDLPPLAVVKPAITGLEARTEVYETAERKPCPPGADACPGILFVVRQRQVVCTPPGLWTLTVRLGLLAQEPMGGKVWLESPAGGPASLLAAFNAAPGMPAYLGASLQVQSLYYDTCYRIRVDTNRPAELIAEPGVSFVTIGG